MENSVFELVNNNWELIRLFISFVIYFITTKIIKSWNKNKKVKNQTLEWLNQAAKQTLDESLEENFKDS